MEAFQWRFCVATSATKVSPQTHVLCSSRSLQRPSSLAFQACRIKSCPRKANNVLVHANAKPLPINSDLSVDTLSDDTKIDEAGWFDVFCRFSRPHTIIGTAIGIISVSLLAVESLSDLSTTFFIGLMQALIPALCMNIYIVGLNQLYDIEIDKVNKPYLPLASGEYSLATGISIVVSSAFLSLALGVMANSRPLLWALIVSLLLGTAYSVELPFLRWKRSAFAAASCILSVRAVVVQLAFFLHMQVSVFKRSPVFPKSLIFATCFMCFFSTVIALFKDIPDVEGDQSFGIRSFSVQIGQRKVFWLCIWLMETAYLAGMSVSGICSNLWSKLAMLIGHGALALTLWIKSGNVELTNQSSITSFYMFIWKLFYAEYLIIPFIR